MGREQNRLPEIQYPVSRLPEIQYPVIYIYTHTTLVWHLFSQLNADVPPKRQGHVDSCC